MMKLFDKRFVHFMWDDALEGKKCFLGDEIDVLRITVEKAGEYDLRSIIFSRNENAPFKAVDGLYAWQFAYYDPNYEVKKAFNEGKKIQVHCANGMWRDCDEPKWYDDCKYRVKPDCPCDDGIDSKACVGCEHSKDGKQYPFENYHCYGCDKSIEKNYRPYKDSAEMIADFMDRFNVNCPAYAEPLIWVKGKETDTKFLLFAFYKTFIKFNDDSPLMFKELFDDYIYLDGSPCGMEVMK